MVRDDGGTAAMYDNCCARLQEKIAFDIELATSRGSSPTTAQRDLATLAGVRYAAGRPIEECHRTFAEARDLTLTSCRRSDFSADDWSPFDIIMSIYPAAYYTGELSALVDAFWNPDALKSLHGRNGPTQSMRAIIWNLGHLGTGTPEAMVPVNPAPLKRFAAPWIPLSEGMTALGHGDTGLAFERIAHWLDREWNR